MDTSFDFCCGCEPTSLYHWRFLFWYSRQRYGLFHSPHLRWGIKILFHSEYYSGEIAVYDYEIAIVDIGKKEPGFISVKFGVTPQVGAHNPLGYDELVYRVDSSGNKELVGYEHLKNFEVPEKFQKYVIKPLE